MAVSRRELLREAVTGAGLAVVPAVVGAAEPAAGVKSTPSVRFGIIGVGSRGTGLMIRLLAYPGVEVRAICDLVQGKIDRASTIVKKVTGITPTGYCGDEYYYRKMLESDSFDAVLVATSIKWHGPMAIDAMNAGKHVGSEVPACRTLDECRRLVEAKERNEVHYFMMEN